ncbi:MAG TPA: AAC(3) family N-acetyltransferase [Clostridia bacterium]|nr:AAC(3) family N-acetyltransferase [Clostridia bacterium]
MSSAVTGTDIENGLRDLGVTNGMALEVHCSLSKFRHVDGGAETVINALKHAVGNDGAIVMPSFMLSPNLPLNDTDRELGLILKIKILQDDDERSAMGIVSDTFRKLPDVITGQGLFRVSAWGRDADKHSLGFQHLLDTHGWALLLGVDIYRLSAMHYVEDSLPVEIRNRFEPSKEARELYPVDQWLIEAWEPSVKPWYTIQNRAYEKGLIKDGMIGDCKCMLLKVREVVELYRLALQTDPFGLYGIK